MKAPTACSECRARKRRCRRLKDGKKCFPCARRHIACSFSRNISEISSNIQAKGAHDESLSDLEACKFLTVNKSIDLVEHYLDFIHDKPHSLFHPHSLRLDVQNGTISKSLLYALCCLGCRFSESNTDRALAAWFRERSKQLLGADLEHICLENIQTCILLANICAADVESAAEALYFGIALRMSDILGLATIKSTDSTILQETKRRVWWSLFMADQWCSSGLSLPRQMTHMKRPASLPMDEEVFHNTRIGERLLANVPQPGLWAHMITLVEIFGKVHDLHKRLAEYSISQLQVDDYVDSLVLQLDEWRDALPPDLKQNEANLNRYRSRKRGSTFVALHLGYHHYASLLIFHYLDDQAPFTPKAATYAQRCRQHASSYSALLQLARCKEDCHIVYATTGHMTVVSSSVLLHTFLFGQERERQAARQSLASNFEALIELKKYWPGLEKWIRRLFVFQNACLTSRDSNTHKIDRWMIKFLLEHANPLEERFSSQFNSLTEVSDIPSISSEPWDPGRQQNTSLTLQSLLH